MPFTFSHPAIILPFGKIKHDAISMSGLVIGSMTPDFEYFIRMKITSVYSHSLEGAILLDLPFAFVSVIVFHQVVKRPAINSAPNYFYKRLIALRDYDFLDYLKKHYFVFTCCLLVGILSHIGWDSFTHATGYFVRGNTFLTSNISIDGLLVIGVYRFLQHASTIIGAFFIILYFHRLPSQPWENNFSIHFWLSSIVFSSAIFGIRASFAFQNFADIIVAIIGAGFIGLVASGCVYYLVSTKKK